MIVLAPVAFQMTSTWAVAGCWGAGATTGAVVAVWQIRYKPVSLRIALQRWRVDEWPFGRWLLLGGGVYVVASYATVVALAGILGAHDYGGLRAVQSLFAPLTLIGPAIALPGLPLLTRAVAVSQRAGLAIAVRLAGVATLATGSYLTVIYANPSLLPLVFGSEFGDFRDIMLPIGLGQLALAPGAALILLFNAQRRGRLVGAVAAFGAVLLLSFSITLALHFGLQGAAWAGLMAAAFVDLALVLMVFRQRPADE
jgi:O-antigen/teichoic acid export membrane protein